MKVILRDARPPRPVAKNDIADDGLRLLIRAKGSRRVLPYMLSGALHLACIWLISLSTDGMAPVQKPTATYAAKAIMIRLPERIFVPSLVEKEAANQPDASERLLKSATALLSQLKGQDGAASSPPLANAPQVTTDGSARKQQILIQPQYSLDLQPPPLSPAVPSIVVWSAQSTVPPPPGKVFTPSRVQRDLPSALMQEAMSELRLGPRIVDVPESVRVSAAQLPVAPPGVTAVKQQSSAAPESRSVAVLSVSDAPLTSQTLIVPPGNIIPKSAGNTARAEATENEDAPNGRGTSPSSSGKGTLTAGAAVGSSQRATPAQPVSSAGSNSSTIEPTGAGSVAARAPEPAKPLHDVAQEMVHAANGRFNVVVIQSSADETLPAGVLSGKPVYTVYVPVGDSKEWVMHFSAGNSSPTQRGGFVQLPDPRPLSAPYPRVTVRPNEALTATGSHLLVRGLIDESGLFQNLQLLGPVQSGASALLEALSRWRFRPATRADSPEKVQMVLAIPLRTAE